MLRWRLKDCQMCSDMSPLELTMNREWRTHVPSHPEKGKAKREKARQKQQRHGKQKRLSWRITMVKPSSCRLAPAARGKGQKYFFWSFHMAQLVIVRFWNLAGVFQVDDKNILKQFAARKRKSIFPVGLHHVLAAKF